MEWSLAVYFFLAAVFFALAALGFAALGFAALGFTALGFTALTFLGLFATFFTAGFFTFFGLLVAFLGAAAFFTFLGDFFGAGFFTAAFLGFAALVAAFFAAGFFGFATTFLTGFLAAGFLLTLKDPDAPVPLVWTSAPFFTRDFKAILTRELFFSTSYPPPAKAFFRAARETPLRSLEAATRLHDKVGHAESRLFRLCRLLLRGFSRSSRGSRSRFCHSFSKLGVDVT